MSSDTIAAALVIIFSILFFGNLPAQNSVVIRNENSLITYKVNYNNSTEKAYSIDTYTYTGTDVSTLKLLGVPEDAWSRFASSEYVIFSTEADKLQKENSRLQEEINAENENCADAQSSLATYRLLFWFLLVASAIAILVLAVNLSSTKKDLRRARSSK